MPVLLVLVVALFAGGVMLFQVGRAADLRAGAQTSADAAALGAVENIKQQLTGHYLTHADTDGPLPINDDLARAAAVDYAERNDARLVSYERSGLDVLVDVETLDTLGEQASRVDSEDARGTARARARLDVTYTLGAPPGLTQAYGHGNNAIPPQELKERAEAAGLTGVPAGSALTRYGGNGGCAGGIDVAHLSREMKIAILKAESMIGPLALSSGYRSVDCQAYLYGTVTGPVAPPGRSMHNYGMAIDVGNWQALTTVAGDVGLCQPLPANDAVHFSLALGPECGGRSGVLGPAGAYGGGLGSFVEFETILVDLDGS